MLNRSISVIDNFTEKVGKSIALLNIVMVVIMCLVVGLRYVFNHSSVALQESVMYLHAIIFMLGMGFTLKHDGHVRVDIFYQTFSRKMKAAVNLAGSLLLLFPVLVFITWYSWTYIFSSWKILEVSQEAAGIPYVYLLKTLIFAMVAMLSLQGLSEVLKSIRTLYFPSTEPEHHSPPPSQDMSHG